VKRSDPASLRGCASGAVLLAILAWPAEGWSRASECPTRDQIAGLFNHWNDMQKKSGG